MSEYYYIALWVSGGVAVLFVLLLPAWILGIPGNPPPGGSSEKAWTIGLFTVLGYPIAWLCLLVSWLIARKLISPEHLPVLQQWTGAAALILLVVAVLLISYAFRNLF
jgi:hypothetical protein